MELYQDGIDIGDGPFVMVPIGINSTQHHVDFKYSFIYLYDMNSNKDFIVNVSHNDYSISNYKSFKQKISKKLVFLYGKAVPPGVNKYVNIELIKWMMAGNNYDFNLPQTIHRYQYWFKDEQECNNFIPIVLWYQYLENIKDSFLLDFPEFKKCEWLKRPLKFYTRMQHNFSIIERNGMQVDLENEMVPYHIQGKLHSNFNYYTSTGRPANRFNGFNFAAMDKNNGIRSIIIPSSKDGLLLEFDYETFHIRLIAKIIGYDLPDTSVHEYFGRKYFKKFELTEEEYDESKKISFRLLYGNELEDVDDLEFFGEVYAFRKKLWQRFNEQGYIQLPLSGRRLMKSNLPEMRESKLFNYFIQGHETEVNSLTLERINQYLFNKRSKIILYTYDSILFDYDRMDGKEVLKKIRIILEEGGYPTSLKYGYNYQKMREYEK